MRIATWNINSVRLRLELVLHALRTYQPDYLCLQETKVVDDLFPLNAFREAGYEHAVIAGMKSYNGVAILSRHPLQALAMERWCGREDCRHVGARLADGTELHNFYIPAGGDIPDVEQNPKFAHKLDFVDEMTSWWSTTRSSDHPMIAVGDFNIAPLESDVWSHKQLLKVVSHTPVEVDKLAAMQASIGWVDAVRHFIPESEKLYSWWSYRARDWDASDKGRRLDHIWVTDPLLPRLKSAQIIREARGWEPKPSDHAPVMVDFEPRPI